MRRPKSKLTLALSGAILLVAAALVLVFELRVRPLSDPDRLGFAMPVVEALLVLVAAFAGALVVLSQRRPPAAPAT